MSPRIAVSVIALLALAGCLLMPGDIAGAYLSAVLFCLGLGAGSIALLLIHALTGGAWGLQLRPPLVAAAQMLPLLAALLIPLLVGAPHFLPWVGTPHGASWYLNTPFFIGRSVVCILLWLWFAYVVRSSASPLFAGLALVVYLMTGTTMSVDWVMSLMPQWHSSVFGLIFCSTQALAAGALAVICARPGTTPGPDLGRLMLTLMLVWGYLVFMDFVTVWTGDLPHEIAWYWPRMRTGWEYLGVWLAVAGLIVPLSALLSGWVKRRLDVLRKVCLLILATQASYMIWLVLPSLHETGWAFSWRDLLPWIGVGGLCWVRFHATHQRLLGEGA